MGRPGQELDGLIEDADGHDAVREPPRGPGEGRNDASSVPDRTAAMAAPASSRCVTTSSSVPGWARWKSRSRPAGEPADHVDAQGRRPGRTEAAARSSARQQVAGVRQERLPVDGELGSARRAGEQPHPEVLLQRGDALGDGLLGDRQIGGGLGELARVRDGDEGAHGIEIHADRP